MIVVDLLNRIVVYLVLDTCLAKMRKQHNSSTTTISSVLLDCSGAPHLPLTNKIREESLCDSEAVVRFVMAWINVSSVYQS